MKKQPKIDIPKSRLEWMLDAAALIIFVFVISYLISNFNALPDRVPGHYNALGKVDRWGGKEELFILPAIAVGVWILMSTLERFPHVYNYINLTEKNRSAQYRNGRLMVNVLKNECVLLFSLLTYQSIKVANGEAAGLGSIFMPLLLFFIFGSMALFFIRMVRL
ncbi:uncharacterized protein DUF1648 [Planomicrobium soli]|uniref:Uncharacterized protein DUF1648 n=1 Tax=Planomicrobium soli TaxID=1176648 RepID=A0A2P8H6G7_9BACL|nr:DUF1648 domain-containing protein [Planomicrobium soli]PSL41812.1 uncharacterized protein DUF1648 [Planomicrobium soli]